MLRISVADETEGEDVIGVPIEREQLFEVDVRTMTVSVPGIRWWLSLARI